MLLGLAASSPISTTVGTGSEYAISGMFAVYRSWFNSDRDKPIERIFEDVGIMTFSGVYGLMGTE